MSALAKSGRCAFTLVFTDSGLFTRIFTDALRSRTHTAKPGGSRVPLGERSRTSLSMANSARAALDAGAECTAAVAVTTGTDVAALAEVALAEPAAEPAEGPPSGERVAELSEELRSDESVRAAMVAGAASAPGADGLLAAGTERTINVGALDALSWSVELARCARKQRCAIELVVALSVGARSPTMESVLEVRSE